MAFVNQDEIAAAREIDLLTYLQRYEPDELIHVAGDVYATRTHDSLKISNGKWCWWSHDQMGGKTALDYLMKVRGMTFPDAVKQVLGHAAGEPVKQMHVVHTSTGKQAHGKQARDSPLLLPPRFENNRRVFAYLSSRGIDGHVINYCIKSRTLYEDAERHNAVFVGYEGSTPRYAFARSTLSQSTFMRELSGSDKRFSFQIPAKDRNCDTVQVFESAIDALSYASLLKHRELEWRAGYCLSLGGVYLPKRAEEQPTLPPALAHFLTTHPHVTRVALCLDNDRVGREASKAIIAAAPRLEIASVPPRVGKDYNEMLCIEKELAPAAKTRGRQRHESER